MRLLWQLREGDGSLMEEIDIYAVRAKDPGTGKMIVVSAWTDVYRAKFEAARWEQDLKTPYDYVRATLILK
jgi:hypothetical protein